jgi:hypothetical protein
LTERKGKLIIESKDYSIHVEAYIAAARDSNKKVSDKWLGEVLLADRRVRDYYANSEFGRFIIRLRTGEKPQALFNRTVLREVRTRGDVKKLAAALQVKLNGD